MEKQTKQLGAWGLVVALVGGLLGAFIPFAGLIALAGWIVAIVAYFRASNELGEPEIKSNIIKVIATVVLALLVVIFSGGMMMAGMMSGSGKMGIGMGGTSFVLLLVAWVLALVASWFWYKANALLSDKTGIGLFKTGGLVMFIGALLAVIVIGGLVSFVGEILLIVAWFSLPEGGSRAQS